MPRKDTYHSLHCDARHEMGRRLCVLSSPAWMRLPENPSPKSTVHEVSGTDDVSQSKTVFRSLRNVKIALRNIGIKTLDQYTGTPI